MENLFVYKILAYADELKTIESSYDEFHAFLRGTARPDFADRDIIAVQFVFSIVPDDSEFAQETPWYINPSKVRIPPYCTVDIYGSKLPSNYPPYLLLLAKPEINILVEFDSFRAEDVGFRNNYLESFTAFSKWYKKRM